ncbi:sterile alpha motif domain-containing protein 14-like, partial [Scomber scombrus]
LNEAIPETELLDNSIQKGRAQLSVKARRHRPSRSRYRDSVSSTEGEDSLERKESALSEEFSPPHTSSSTSPPVDSSSSRSSHPYHTLSQSSDETCEDSSGLVSSWTSQQVCQWLRGLNMDHVRAAAGSDLTLLLRLLHIPDDFLLKDKSELQSSV